MSKSISYAVAIVLVSLATLTTSLSTAPPFNILVQTPSHPTSTPIYLTGTGTTTTTRSQGAVCWLSPYSELFCGNFQTAIGLPTTSDATKITACTATDCGTKGWAIDNADLTLGWQDADFAYKSSDGTTWAVFEGGGVSDAVGAKLVAKFS